MVFHVGWEESEVPNQWVSLHSFDSRESTLHLWHSVVQEMSLVSVSQWVQTQGPLRPLFPWSLPQPREMESLSSTWHTSHLILRLQWWTMPTRGELWNFIRVAEQELCQGEASVNETTLLLSELTCELKKSVFKLLQHFCILYFLKVSFILFLYY